MISKRDRGERLDPVGADPVLVQHAQSRPACSGARASHMDAHDAQCRPIAERNGGTGCRDIEWNWLGTDDQGRDVVREADLRIPNLGAVRADPRRHIVGDRRAGRRGAGLFRRLGRSHLPTLHRSVDRDPGPVPPHHHIGHHHTELLRAARHPFAVLVGLARGRRPRRIPAGAQPRICARCTRVGAVERQPSCSAISCPTPWWRR